MQYKRVRNLLYYWNVIGYGKNDIRHCNWWYGLVISKAGTEEIKVLFWKLNPIICHGRCLWDILNWLWKKCKFFSNQSDIDTVWKHESALLFGDDGITIVNNYRCLSKTHLAKFLKFKRNYPFCCNFTSEFYCCEIYFSSLSTVVSFKSRNTINICAWSTQRKSEESTKGT